MMESSHQPAMCIATSSTTYTEPAVHFEIEKFGAGYGGSMTKNNSEIVCNWKQGGAQVPFLGKTVFVVLKDCSGEMQCVAAPKSVAEHRLKLEDTVEIVGRVRQESRAKLGYELDISRVRVLSRSGQRLPFTSFSNLDSVNPDTLVECRPLALRNEAIGSVFRVQAALLRFFREFLIQRRFTEIVTSKLVSSGTEGGTNLFEVKYFDRVAYLAQSPQFYKEHGVAGFEGVFETGHVYRAEPHATSRHLTEYYSLDLEFGFIDGPEDVIQLERELLTYIFENLNEHFGDLLSLYRQQPLPSMLANVPPFARQMSIADQPSTDARMLRTSPESNFSRSHAFCFCTFTRDSTPTARNFSFF